MRISDAAVARYQELVKPALSSVAARDDLVLMLAMADRQRREDEQDVLDRFAKRCREFA